MKVVTSYMDHIYELSISNKYVSDWNVKDAIREILQNAIDGNTNGHEMYINYDKVNQLITIGNKFSKINTSELVLGNSSKSNNEKAIGKFGEGFKLALVVLLRNGHNVEINNCDKRWTPFFEYSENFNTEVLKIRSTVLEGCTSLEFAISNIDNSLYQTLMEYFPCIHKKYGKTIETAYGDILLEPEFQGKMFVEGLFVQKDDSFEFGYNFRASEVSLDRDRKAINYYHLKKLTAKSALTAKELNNKLYTKIVKGSNDTSSIKNLDNIMSFMDKDFASMFKEKFFGEHKLDEGVVVATPEVVKELEKKGINAFSANENVSKIINCGNYNEALIDDTKKEIKNRDKYYVSWDTFKWSWLRKSLKFMYSVQKKLNPNEQEELKELIFDEELMDYSIKEILEDVMDNLPECLEDSFVDKKIEYYS